MNKKFATAGLLAGLVAGTGAGLILEQSGFAGAASPSAVIVDDTTDTGDTSHTGDTARPDRTARLTDVLQPLVDDGTITADQLTKVVAALDAAGPLGRHGGRGRHGNGGDGGHGGGGRGAGIEAAATALGVTVEELHTALRDGTTIAALAATNGVDVQTVVDAMVAEATTRLAERVTAGDLTQAEADAKLTDVTARITDVVNNGRPARHGHGRADTDADTAATTTDA